MFGIDDAIGGLAGLGTAIAGAVTQQQGNQARQEQLQHILDMYQRMGLPVLPELAAQTLDSSAQARVTSDPNLELAQMQSLRGLQDTAATGGNTQADRAAMYVAENDANQNARARERALQASLDSRGLGSSGAAMALRAGGAREAANTSAMAGMKSQLAARERALAATQAGGQLAGSIRGQQFNERDRAAQARDAWAKYNADARTSANRYNAALPQQNFNNQMTVNQQIAAARSGVGNGAAANAQQAGQQIAGLGQAGGEFVGQAIHASRPAGSVNYDPYSDDVVPAQRMY